MKHIRVKAEHFNSITNKDVIRAQYTDNCDCPIYRACKDAGIDIDSVSSYTIRLDNDREYPIINKNGELKNIRNIAKHLANGGKYGIIKIDM